MLAIDGLAMAGLAPPVPPTTNAWSAQGLSVFARALADAALRQPVTPECAVPSEQLLLAAAGVVVPPSIGLGMGPAPGATRIEAASGPDRSSEAMTAVDGESDEDTTILGEIMALQSAMTTLVPVAVTGPRPETTPIDPAMGSGHRAIEAGARPAPRVAEAIDVAAAAAPATEGVEPTLVASIEAIADVAAPGEGRNETDAPRAVGPPADQLGPVIRDLPVDERSAIASAWNRSGGRFGDDVAPVIDAAPSGETPSTEAQVAPIGSVGSADIDGRDSSDSASRDDEPLSRDVGVPAIADSNEAATRLGLPVGGTGGPQPLEGVTVGPLDTTPVDATDVHAVEVRLADSVVQATQTGDDSIRLVLNPPELGHLDIHVQHTDGGLRVEVTAATAEAADIIQQALPGLVSGLEARALRVDRAEVHVGTAGTGLPGESGSDAGRSSRQSGERGSDGQPQWARPDWSEAARMGGADTARGNSRRAAEQLLDLVA